MALAAHLGEVRQVVGEGIGVVDEPALLDEQLAGGGTRGVAGEPADRPLPAGLLERADRSLDLPPLLVALEPHRVGPAPAVTRGLVAGLVDPLAHLGVPLDGDGGRIEGHAQAVLVEQA